VCAHPIDEDNNSSMSIPARQRQQHQDTHGKCQGKMTTTMTMTTAALHASTMKMKMEHLWQMPRQDDEDSKVSMPARRRQQL